jgi:Flp pilus assembly protein TadD
LILAGGLYYRSHQSKSLTDKDTIVLADFANSTGDPVFDDTLKTALNVSLRQSPFLNVLSDSEVAKTLQQMTRPASTKLTPEVARELCQRAGSKAYIGGSVGSLGSEYVLGLKAVNCQSGDTLAEEQVTAKSKEKALDALGEAASKLRGELGESLATVRKFDIPLVQATTPSLEALKAYSLGYRAQVEKADFPSAILFFQRATSLDANFAMAYAALGTNYRNLGKPARAAENTRKAYELRERVSEREKFYIASHYEDDVNGDLEASRKIKELWLQTYPRDYLVAASLGTTYSILGEHSKALAAHQQALKLDPESALSYAGIVFAHLNLNRLDEAKAAAQEARAHNLDSPQIHYALYAAYFVQHDAAGMEREAAGLRGKAGEEDGVLSLESDTAAYDGQFSRARELTRRAIASAQRGDEKETAADYEAEAALREVLVGNMDLARQQALAALALSRTRDVEAISAIVLGLGGRSAEVMRLTKDLTQQFPKDTIVQSEYLPMIRAATILGMDRGPKDADMAIEALVAAAPYELGSTAENLSFALYPAYLRGESYLAARQGAAAVNEFLKLVDHSGVVGNEPIGALAYLGLGRAYALDARPGAVPATVAGAPRPNIRIQVKRQDAGITVGETSVLQKARASYQHFFSLWGDAEPGVPILKEAKMEYAKLE